MTKEQLASNLGTIARSGTSEFLEKLEKGDGGNLIGQFGLGFYSSFLVADRVTVASKTADEAEQWVFESEANAEGFRIIKDRAGPRLAVVQRSLCASSLTHLLRHGRALILPRPLCRYLKPDARGDYLDVAKLRSLIQKHAEYNAAPIYLWSSTLADPTAEAVADKLAEDDELKVEDADAAEAEVAKAEWELINDRPPLWMREPKDVTEDEYECARPPVRRWSGTPLTEQCRLRRAFT